jgi:hypothetical protein
MKLIFYSSLVSNPKMLSNASEGLIKLVSLAEKRITPAKKYLTAMCLRLLEKAFIKMKINITRLVTNNLTVTLQTE